ncbi:MAG: hypothetical protein KTR25_01010 [Myxococcales bacterium]|nr:hypothetical protein [Myxococcales bacterium]
MDFLVAEVALLFVFASLLGAVGMRYWIYLNVEDVTDAYILLERTKVEDRDKLKDLMVLKERFENFHHSAEARLNELCDQIHVLGEQVKKQTWPTQVATLETRLNEICGGKLDLTPVLERLRLIEVRLVDLERDIVGSEGRGGTVDHERLDQLVNRMESVLGRDERLGSEQRRALEPALRVVDSEVQAVGGEDRSFGITTSHVLWREGSRNLLTEAAFGPPDPLRKIAGVGPVLERTLHRAGVFYFWQIAEWDNEDITFVDTRLASFRGRIRRDDWVSQAGRLSRAPDAAQRPAFKE